MNVHEQVGAKMAAGKHLSLLHAMLASIEVQKDAKRLNEIVNHPDVLPWVTLDGAPLDMTEAVKSPDVVVLLGAHGGMTFHRLQPGLWEAHVKVLPEGRGEWAKACTQACFHWLFTHTDAVEAMMRCPKGNPAVRAMIQTVHGQHDFTAELGWVKDGRPVAADVFALSIQGWIRTAPGLVERGRWFRETEQGAAQWLDHADLDRHTGMAWEMAQGGQRRKAAVFYNRWAVMAGYPPLNIEAPN